MDSLHLQFCDIQGRLFELSRKEGYSSPVFIRTFMTSDIAKGFDSTYNRYQWAGEEYLLEELAATTTLTKDTTIYNTETLYWTGYLYRYWQISRNISSSNIVKLAPAETMNRNYLMFHTLDPEIAIDNLIEIHNQKKSSRHLKKIKID